MSETIDYAEMLEIPVNTLNVTKKRSKRRKGPTELKEQVVETVNERVENAQYDENVVKGRTSPITASRVCTAKKSRKRRGRNFWTERC